MVSDYGAQGLETAVDRCACVLLVALGIRDMPGDVPNSACGLGNCRELGNIGRRSEGFNLPCEFLQLVFALAHCGVRVLDRRDLPAASIQEVRRVAILLLAGIRATS